MVGRRDFIIRQAKDVLGDVWENRGRLGIRAKTPLDLFPLDLPLILKRQNVTCDTTIDFPEYPSLSLVLSKRRKMGHANHRPLAIAVAENQPPEQYRFTVAHELAHVLLHAGVYHERNWVVRDDYLLGPAPTLQEVEANLFAANLLMPKKILSAYVRDCFGGPIDGRRPNEALAFWLSVAAKRDLDPVELANCRPFYRAKLVSQIWTCRTNRFLPLVRKFGLSPTALAIQLCELGLVL